eukprot:jgi/Mesen1/9192/ME000591S08518
MGASHLRHQCGPLCTWISQGRKNFSLVLLTFVFTTLLVPSNSAPENTCLTESTSSCNPFESIAIANYSGPMPCSTEEGSPKCVDLEGKVALITGASSGMGRAVGERLAAAGMQVVGTSRWPWKHERDLPSFPLWQMDQTSSESVKQLVARVNATYGRVDLLFLGAGRNFLGDVANSDLRQMQAVFETNFWGPIRVLQAALPLLPTSGYARIVQLSSIQSQLVPLAYSMYAASKFAIQALQEAFILETYNSTNIDYVTVMPGKTETNIGHTPLYGCPEVAGSAEAQSIAESYHPPSALAIGDAAEALFRIAVNPAPEWRYVMAPDSQLDMFRHEVCVRQTQPMKTWFGPRKADRRGGEVDELTTYSCSRHCGNKQFCGPGPLGSGSQGAGTVSSY